MFDPTKFISTQPENRSLIEESLEFAWRQLIASIENPYPNLKQPLYTQLDFINLLAAERGVLDWQPNDNLAQRRNTAEQAFDIHRKAGTRQGLKEALAALDIESEVTKGDLPYSISIDGLLSDEPLTDETSSRINNRIQSYKSERDSVSLRLSRSTLGESCRGILVQSAKFIHVYAGIPEPPKFDGSNTKYGFVQSEKVIEVQAAVNQFTQT